MKLRYFVEYVLFRLLIGFICFFSPSVSVKVGRFLGRLACKVDRKHRRIAVDNLSMALGMEEEDALPFTSLLSSLGATVQMDTVFADHHSFTLDDIKAVLKEAAQQGISMIVMTEKDAVKMESLDIVSEIPIFYLAITLDMQRHDDAFIETIISRAEAGIN